MFYFLIVTGSAFVLFGLYSRKRQQAEGLEPVLQAAKPETQEEASRDAGIEALRIRMDQIEKLIFQSLMVQEGRKSDVRQGIMESRDREQEQLSVEGVIMRIEEGDTSSEPVITAGKSPAVPAHEEGFTTMDSGILEQVEPVEIRKRKPMPDNIRAIADYEMQGLSVQEIVNVTKMKKGEVLLLKNLSKHYTR